MTLVDGDIIQINAEQELAGESILNIFYYITSLLVTGVTLLDILIEFRDLVIEAQRELQATELTHTNIHAQNLSNELDEEDLVLGLDGVDSAGEVLSTFTAAGFALLVETKITRNGAKRVAGILEGRVNGQVYIAGEGLDTAYAEALAALIPVTGTPSGVATMFPIVVGRDLLGALDLTKFNVVTSAIVKTNITSQTSRKQVI